MNSYVARTRPSFAGRDGTQFHHDERALLAMRYALLVIGEASRHLEGQAGALCPDIPWASIRGLGNWLRHGYDRIDPAVLCQTVAKALGSQQLCAMRR
jgi:uncharacterized protein with HEPN domain